MLFYHYTCPTNVMLIAEQGLLPDASDDNGFMTDNMPVVWLTRQQTNITTAAQAAHYKKLGVDMPGTKEGDETFGGAARLNVRLEPQKRLMKYSDFLRKNVPAAVAATRAHLTPTAWENWYVFLGIIPHVGLMPHCPRRWRSNASTITLRRIPIRTPANGSRHSVRKRRHSRRRPSGSIVFEII
jgi:hypothetical protein